MTVGVAVLSFFEPGQRRTDWRGSALLAADRGVPDVAVEDVEIVYASPEYAEEMVYTPGAESVCVVYADGRHQWRRSGPHWMMIVTASNAGRMGNAQQRKLLGVLRSLNDLCGRDLVPIRLAPELQDADLPPQAEDLRNLLLRKKLIK